MTVKENKKTFNAVTLATTDVIDNCIYFAFLDLELMSGTLEKDCVTNFHPLKDDIHATTQVS